MTKIKTKSLRDILDKCDSLGWKVDDVVIETKMFNDIRNTDLDMIVEIFIKNKNEKN
jgi:hypothetical protein